jgi:hypothetical protein
MTPAKRSAVRDVAPLAAADTWLSAADALYRAADEASRQHERVARLIDKHCADDELQDAALVCDLCYRQLAARTAGYEATASSGKGKGTADEAIWHAANTLWHSSREYARRHHSCDAIHVKTNRHSSDHLGELTMEYELEASALLALRHALAGFRKARPEADYR